MEQDRSSPVYGVARSTRDSAPRNRQATALAVAALEAGEPVAGAAQLPRHDQRVVPSLVPEHPEVRVAEDLGAGLEVDAVRGHRHPCALLAVFEHAVVVHADLVAVVVDVHIGRCDVGMEIVLLDRVRRIPAHRLAHVRGIRTHCREVRCLQRERSRCVYPPRAGERVGAGEADVETLVMGEVEVVATERIFDPVRNPDERRSVDVRAHPAVHAGLDDRPIKKACGPDRVHSGLPRKLTVLLETLHPAGAGILPRNMPEP